MNIIRKTKWALLELFPEQKETETEAEKAFRKAAKAKAKALDAEKNAQAMGVTNAAEKDPSSSDN